MFAVITNKEDFIHDPVLEMNEEQLNNSATDTIHLLGKKFRMYADDWKHHVHIKCTDRCDADCEFCIEKSERNNPQNESRVMEVTARVLTELALQGHLKTVSITGGEPTIFREFEDLVELIGSYNLKLFSINTNGRRIDRIPKSFNGWVDISKHAIDDRDIFKRDFLVSPQMLTRFKETHKNAKVRLQCVLGTTYQMITVGNIVDFINMYKDVIDDFSFRNLIIEDKESKVLSLLLDFRKMLFDHGEFVEQVIQDYYVYETFKMFGTTITLSWSNMKELREYNETHDSDFFEEIIVHPDGTVSGSWNKKSLVIFQPTSVEDTFIPCRGENCEHRCARYDAYLKEQQRAKKREHASRYVDTFGKAVDACGKPISGC